MKITRLYKNENGNTSFEDLDISFEGEKAEKYVTLPNPTKMLASQIDAGYSFGFHPAPTKQWVLTMGGTIEIALKDGSSRLFEAGSIILADDCGSTGHNTTVISSENWECLYLPIEENIEDVSDISQV